jgi:hypothetical protein
MGKSFKVLLPIELSSDANSLVPEPKDHNPVCPIVLGENFLTEMLSCDPIA